MMIMCAGYNLVIMQMRARVRETVKPHFIQTFEEMGGKWALTWIQQWIAREFSYMYEWYAFIDESSIGVPS